MGATKEKIKRIYETLPQLNCGLCGFENCGQFAKAVAEGRASPFGCRQNPWIGYEVSDIIGLRTPFSGYPNRFYQPSLMSGPGLSPSLESLGKEVRGLLSRMESILDRIDTLGKRRRLEMPQGDGTGPRGQGPGTGRGQGRGGGRGRMGGSGLGVGGECVCPNCGHRATHQRGTPCYEMRCPKCGTPMTR